LALSHALEYGLIVVLAFVFDHCLAVAGPVAEKRDVVLASLLGSEGVRGDGRERLGRCLLSLKLKGGDLTNSLGDLFVESALNLFLRSCFKSQLADELLSIPRELERKRLALLG
jgi:hypothetical protein